MFFQILISLIFVINYACGKEERIIGGDIAIRADFPYQAVLRRISDNLLIGGAAIISHKHIITAAHCVDDRFVSHANLKISLGPSNSTHMFISEFLPNRIYVHPQFTGGLDPVRSLNNDIALIRIRENIRFNIFQNKVSLPDSNIKEGDIAILTGWGTISHPNLHYPNILQRAEMTLINTIRCKTMFPLDVFHDQFCAFHNEGTGPCVGDGGAPLVRDGILIGIFSMSYLCAAGVPDVYTNIYSHINFIRTVIAS